MLHDKIIVAFETYSQFGRVSIRHSAAISTLSTMHEDIFHVAEEKRVGMIILPFHRQRGGNGEEAVDSVGHGWGEVNQTVLQNAPCSVAVLVDRGFGYGSERVAEPASIVPKRVCILFFGGSDDRKAIKLGGRIAQHTATKVTLLRFLLSQDTSIKYGNSPTRASINYLREKELDEITVEEFMREWNGKVGYNEMVMSNGGVELLRIAQSREYELIVVGKGRFSSTMEEKFAHYLAENVELGTIGNVLASSDHSVLSSVLVIQQHNTDDSNKTTVSKIITVNNATIAEESCA